MLARLCRCRYALCPAGSFHCRHAPFFRPAVLCCLCTFFFTRYNMHCTSHMRCGLQQQFSCMVPSAQDISPPTIAYRSVATHVRGTAYVWVRDPPLLAVSWAGGWQLADLTSSRARTVYYHTR